MYIQQLIEQLGFEKVSLNETDLYRHSQDESNHPAVEPDVVCFPESKTDIQHILAVASEHLIPVTPFGAGSGLEGQAIPVRKGIVINFEQMNQILKISPEDMAVTVQPGVTRLQLNKLAGRHGLMFPVDPGADATIGGMVATNASGTTAVRYGSMRDQLLNLEVILADGTIIKTGSDAKKSSSGYHLTGLFAGSEGTLGIITEITLKLHGIPEHTCMARCTFESPELCAAASNHILASSIPVMRMELIDAASIAEMNKTGNRRFPAGHSLFFEFSGSKGAVAEDIELAASLMADLGCHNWAISDNPTEQKEIWRARHELSYSFQQLKGLEEAGADVCVPLSRLPELVAAARRLIDESGLKGAIWGHIGDGNFHTSIAYHSASGKEQQKAEAINDALALLAIEMGGTCTGEHGVGLGKRKFQLAEHGAALEIMKRTKQLYDPKGILNPGKIFPS
ncbi:MAG: FAD-binding oxidoreductase [Bacillus sp. (in: firmicutes)]